MNLFKSAVTALTLIVMLSGCAGVAVKSDDLADLALEKDVNASTGGDENSNTLGSYSSKYNEKSSGRAHNIKLAAEKLNQTKVEPGQVFSYNDSIGPTGKSAGFKKARIFVRGTDAEGYGGGVCQVSSTLYNAALEAGLEIVERHPHSKPVGYVPEDKDAATSYGGVDFKFKNNTDGPLIIEAAASEGNLTTTIKAG